MRVLGRRLGRGQARAGHGLEHGDALAHVAAALGALLALVDEQLGDAQQLDGDAPHQVRQRVFQPQHAAQHLPYSTRALQYVRVRMTSARGAFTTKYILYRRVLIKITTIGRLR